MKFCMLALQPIYHVSSVLPVIRFFRPLTGHFMCDRMWNSICRLLQPTLWKMGYKVPFADISAANSLFLEN